jgi:hypothetical protein
MDAKSIVYIKSNHLRNGNDGNGSGGGHHSPLLITGRNLAHSHRTASQRGALAAQLVLEEVEHIKPTMIQAAAVTRANIPYVQFALRLTPETRARVAAGEFSLAEAAKANGLLAAWIASTPAEKAALGSAVGVNEIWDSAIQPLI